MRQISRPTSSSNAETQHRTPTAQPRFSAIFLRARARMSNAYCWPEHPDEVALYHCWNVDAHFGILYKALPHTSTCRQSIIYKSQLQIQSCRPRKSAYGKAQLTIVRELPKLYVVAALSTPDCCARVHTSSRRIWRYVRTELQRPLLAWVPREKQLSITSRGASVPHQG